MDSLIGSKLRKLRILMGISQEELGDYIGVSFQQIQKYEKGQSKITASKLFEIANFLGKDVSFFFKNNDNSYEENNNFAFQEEQEQYITSSNNKEIIALVKSYMSIKDEAVRKKLLALIKSLQ